MDTVWTVVLFAVGLVLIIKGGDVFVDAASWMARVSGIPQFVIGATIVSMATTLPELLVSLFAALEGSADIAVGNAVGSVTANIGLIMSISIICIPAAFSRKALWKKATLMVCAIALLYLFSLSGTFGVVGSLVLLALLAVHVVTSIMEARRGQAENTEERPAFTRKEFWINIAKFVLGAAAIVVGAQLLVDNGAEIARILGVPEGIIGVTLIAIGTSLPELVTTITAIVKKQPSMSIGNIIGANIIDLALILPVCSLIGGGTIAVSHQSLALDLPACLAFGLLSMAPALISQKFCRSQGIVMLVGYALYVAALVIWFV